MFEKTFTFWRHWIGQSAVAQPAAAIATQDDRRLWSRYETDLPGQVELPEQTSAKLPVTIRDLSLGGANLLLDRPLAPGQMLSVEIHTDADEIRTLLACVVRVTPAKDSLWSLGCVFSRELSSEDLSHFGASKVAAEGADQRKWVRFHCEIKATYRKVGAAEEQVHAAQVLNISANGIGLAVTPPLDTGSLLNVELFDKHGCPVRTILACVVHTTLRTSGALAVGCNFIRELSEEELQSLL